MDPLIINLLDKCTEKSEIRKSFKVYKFILKFDYITVPQLKNINDDVTFGDWRNSKLLIKNAINNASSEELEELILYAEEFLLLEI